MGFSQTEPHGGAHRTARHCGHAGHGEEASLVHPGAESCALGERLRTLLTHPGGMVGYPPSPSSFLLPFHCWITVRTSLIPSFWPFMREMCVSYGPAPSLSANSETGDIPASGLSSGQC